ncbi:tetratricopeptide repeat-containing sensor histidine kinase [Aquimarina sp. AU58]|uniref:tetratricopeptide repeat-containing sensor histidine kinase n=1 Tax=Aquimarina sp. AU58 TaxID=1874112 RepID=UPI000D6E7463|nr:tetratricopeptide repeat-containing sensor histidine kinase [Aquimarina sp. AU58]
MLRFLHLLFIYGILILPFIINAQIKKGDSLLVSEEVTLESKERKLLNKVYQYLGTKKDKETYSTSHNILKKTKYQKSKLQAYINLGKYFNYKSQSDSALFYGNNALQLIGKRNDSTSMKGKSSACDIVAISYNHKGLFKESKKWFFKGLEVAKKLKDKWPYYVKLNNLANIHIRLQEYDSALKLLKICLEYKENPRYITKVYGSVSILYGYEGDYEKALLYSKKALEFYKKDKSLTGLTLHGETTTLMNIGVHYSYLGEKEKAIEYYNKAYLIAKDRQFNRTLVNIAINLGEAYQDKEMYNEAIKKYHGALSVAKKLGFLDKQIIIYYNLKMVAIAQNDHKSSYSYFEKEIKIKDSVAKLQKSKEINELEVKFNTLQKEKEIKVLQVENANRELDLKNQKEAVKNLKLQQEIEKKDTQNKILSFQNASEKKRNEIALLKKDQEIQESKLARQKSIKNSILYSFLILLIPVIGLLFTYYQKLQTQNELNKKQEEISEQKISSLIKDQELKLIKASIKGQDKERKRIAQELHDSIGGNLAAIKLQLNNTVLHGDKKTITTINNQLDDTYDQVRNLSHNLIPKKFSENNFCDVLEEYFNNIGGTTSLSTSFVAYPRTEIDILDETLQIEIFKIIQELITNTIKHAKATSVELQLNLVENIINVLFEDNGIGFNTKNKATGLGFENIKNRLKKISGTFHIDSRINRGTIIDIEVPVFTPINNKIL